MKVLIVIDSLGASGGTERWMVYMLPELRRRGVEIEVAALMPPYALGDKLAGSGVRVHRLDLHHRWSLAEATAKLGWVVRRGRFDVVHGRLYFGGMYTATTRSVAPRAKRVVSFHNLAYDYPDMTTWTEVRRRWESFLMRRDIDAFAAVSVPVAAHYEKHLGLSGVEVIHNAVPIDSIQPRDDLDRSKVLEAYGVRPDDIVVSMPARQVHEKGHRFVLEALDMLRGRGHRPKVIFLGGGPMAEHTRNEIRTRRLEDQVVFRDHDVPHDEVLRVLDASDIAILASTLEGFPHAAAEAMAVGAPLLATRVGGLIDLVEEEVSGILVAPGQPAEIAVQLERLIVDPELRKRLGAAARKRVVEHFSVSEIAARWESFYRRVAAAA